MEITSTTPFRQDQPNYSGNGVTPFQPLEQTDDEEVVHVGVYRFHPSPEIPKLVILSAMGGANSTVKAVVRRESILIVTDHLGEWWDISCSGFQGWVKLPDAIEKGAFRPVDSFRRYEDWRGNNYFFCWGRIMMGSDAKLFGFSNFLIIVPSLSFFFFVVPRLPHALTTGVNILTTLAPHCCDEFKCHIAILSLCYVTK
jgi:hypothetical protein